MEKAQLKTIFFLILNCAILGVTGEKEIFSLSVKRGGKIELACNLKNETLNSSSWKYKKEPSSLEKTIAKRNQVKNGNFNLMVSLMSSSKEGYYTCYANNKVINEYKLNMLDSCTINKITKSVKKNDLLLKLLTRSDNLAKCFAGLKVNAKCDRTTKVICDIALPYPNTTNCGFVESLSDVIIVPNSKKYHSCNTSVTFTKTPHFFTPDARKFTVNAEDEAPSTEKSTILPVTNLPRPSNVSTLTQNPNVNPTLTQKETTEQSLKPPTTPTNPPSMTSSTKRKSTQQPSPTINNPPPELGERGKTKDCHLELMVSVACNGILVFIVFVLIGMLCHLSWKFNKTTNYLPTNQGSDMSTPALVIARPQ